MSIARYRFVQVTGILVAGIALLLLAANAFVGIRVVDRANAYFMISKGNIIVGCYAPPVRSAHSGRGGIFEPADPRFELHRGRYGIGLYSRTIWVGARIPHWFLFIIGAVLAVVSHFLRNIDACRLKLCLKCGYDLRGTPGDRCSECGTVIRHTSTPLSSWPMSSFRAILALYLLTGALWAACMGFYGSGTSFWWPNNPIAGFLAQLWGPLCWVVSAFWPFMEKTVGHFGAVFIVGILAISITVGWVAIVRRTRFVLASMATHLGLAIAWYCAGPLATGVGLWVLVR